MRPNKPAQERLSEIVFVRLDPELKRLADLAARKQDRSLSGYIRWLVVQALDDTRKKAG